MTNIESPTFLAQILFEVPASPATQKSLPRELNNKIFDYLDKRTLCSLRPVSKFVCAHVDGLQRRDCGKQPLNLPGQAETFGSLLRRQKEARACLKSGEISRTFLEVDADPQALDKMCVDQTADDVLVWTRRGQLIAVGPYAQNGMQELLPPASLPLYSKNQTNFYSTQAWPCVLKGIHLSGVQARRILSFHPSQGLRFWRCVRGQPPTYATLQWSPRHNTLDGKVLPSDLQFTLGAEGDSVFLEDKIALRMWRWHIPQEEGGPILPDYNPLPPPYLVDPWLLQIFQRPRRPSYDAWASVRADEMDFGDNIHGNKYALKRFELRCSTGIKVYTTPVHKKTAAYFRQHGHEQFARARWGWDSCAVILRRKTQHNTILLEQIQLTRTRPPESVRDRVVRAAQGGIQALLQAAKNPGVLWGDFLAPELVALDESGHFYLGVILLYARVGLLVGFSTSAAIALGLFVGFLSLALGFLAWSTIFAAASTFMAPRPWLPPMAGSLSSYADEVDV